MNKTLFIVALTLLSYQICFSQEKTTDSTATESVKGTWDLNLDLASRYIWRGQAWGGNYPVAQLYGTYNLTEKLSLGFWATHNFQKQSFEENDFGAEYRGYQEIDLVANYAFTNYLTTSLQYYYWPTTEKVEGVSNKLFDFGNTGVSTLDLMLMFDFSEYKLPLWFTWSTFIAGNDYRYKDEFDEKGKQNFTSYAEVGYNFDLPASIKLSPVVGAVFNNKAAYYTYGDPDKISFVNIGAKASKEFKLSKKSTMPIWVSYTHNGASRQFAVPETTRSIKSNYVVFGATFNLTN
ncbi:hypothetical protein DHW03_05800 [Pedobacter yonginense]|uniref:DUF3078 domain-containing protein n=1 Tax=Pedobacter yonginense TaxID=651869 RepID=A0A317EVV4_9SPHI|nr:hypothetical protein [Pedobacter yonginense]PWS29328.1 hypothetical protein DHW03_05800 [Pedobacter yonginense]